MRVRGELEDECIIDQGLKTCMILSKSPMNVGEEY